MEDLWFAIPCQRHLQGIGTELLVKAVRGLPAEDISGEQINDRHQVEESLLQRDVGDIGGLDLIHCRDRADIHKAGETARMDLLGLWFGASGRSPVNPCGA